MNPKVESPGLALFVRRLAAEGRAVVFQGELTERDDHALPALVELEARARCELSGDAPAFNAPVALWAARLFYEAARCTVCRGLGVEVIQRAFAVPCPAPRGPDADWSADLTLRHLPTLFRFARQLSNADPLVVALQSLAAAWPLSSVGIGPLGDLALESFYGHPALRRLYADRIVAADDRSRLEDARVAELLRADVGLHRELAPALAARLFPDPESAGPGTAPKST